MVIGDNCPRAAESVCSKLGSEGICETSPMLHLMRDGMIGKYSHLSVEKQECPFIIWMLEKKAIIL